MGEIGSWTWGELSKLETFLTRGTQYSNFKVFQLLQATKRQKMERNHIMCLWDWALTRCHKLTPIFCLPLRQIRGNVRRWIDALPYADTLCVLSAHNSERLIYFWMSKCLVAWGEMSQILLPKDETIRSCSQHPHMAKYHRSLQLANSTPGKDSSAFRSPIQLKTYYLL